jgi:hypothetical protein
MTSQPDLLSLPKDNPPSGPMPVRTLICDGVEHDVSRYYEMHARRFRHSIEALRRHVSGRVLEIGGHPWAMTSMIARTPGLELAATVSAEEETLWPDDIGVTRTSHTLELADGWTGRFTNYALNIERTLTDLEEPVDGVFACEVIEHLVRSPHIMLLNLNRWLRTGGMALISTPNGMQFSNPLRRKNGRPAYRCHCYERHNGMLTLEQLVDLTERAGFRVAESGYWHVYQRRGLSRFYNLPQMIPLPYFQAKFSRTIYVIAEKIESRDRLRGLPSAYSPDPAWELIEQ